MKKISKILVLIMCLLLALTLFASCDKEEDNGGVVGPQGIQGPKGDKGDAGRGIKNMWVDEDLHLWVEYDDGSLSIDLGYVGVETTTPDDNLQITKPTIIVSSATASSGDTVQVTISLKNNPGVALLDLKISYDESVLTLTDLSFNTDFGGTGTRLSNYASPTSLLWYNGADNSNGDMVVATLTFDVASNAPKGNSEISLSYVTGGICDIYEEDIEFDVINGFVKIS